MRNILLISFILIQTLCFSQNAVEANEGMKLFWKGEYSKSLKFFEKQARNDNSYDTKFWIASCYFKMEEMRTAKKIFLEIVNSQYQGSALSMSLINLGSCYRSLNQADSAFYFYDAAIVLFPNLSSGYFNKAQFLYTLDRFEEAGMTYTQAIAVNPAEFVYYMKRMEIFFILQQYDKALSDILQAKKLKPDLDIDFNLAYCFSMLERYPEADSVYQKIYDENNSSFLNNYGFNKHKLGKSKEGTDLIMKSLKLEPGNAYAYRNLAWMALDEGNISAACNYLREAKQLNFFTNYGSEVDELLKKYCE